MSDSVLQRYAIRKDADAADAEADVPEDLGPFGWLRGIRDRAVMLQLGKRDGNILAINYGWIERAEFDPSDGIILHASGRKIRITGQNLNAEVRPSVRLFDGIARHRVPWVQEVEDPLLVVDRAKATVVVAIAW